LQPKGKEKAMQSHLVKVILGVSIYRSCLGILDLLPYSLFLVQPFPYVRKVGVWNMGNLRHLDGLGFNGWHIGGTKNWR
jgi:hypothetical protein